MKILTTIIVLVISSYQLANEKNIPSSISYSVRDGHHIYTISGLHPSYRDEVFKYEAELAKDITGCIEARVNKVKDQLTLVCDNELTNLKNEMNHLMEWGLFPGWDELLTRDERSENYETNLYRKALETTVSGSNTRLMVKHEFKEDGSIGLFFHSGTWSSSTEPDTLSEYTLRYSEGEFVLLDEIAKQVISREENVDLIEKNIHTANLDSVIVQYHKELSGILVLNVFTDYCMDYSWYALRLFTDIGEYIWEDPYSLCGFVKIIPHDMDNDGVDELIVFSSAHKNRRVLVYNDE